MRRWTNENRTKTVNALISETIQNRLIHSLTYLRTHSISLNILYTANVLVINAIIRNQSLNKLLWRRHHNAWDIENQIPSELEQRYLAYTGIISFAPLLSINMFIF